MGYTDASVSLLNRLFKVIVSLFRQDSRLDN